MKKAEKIDRFLSSVVSSFFSLIKVQIAEEKILGLVQFIKFCVVGITNTGISYLVNVIILLGLKPFKFRLDYIVGNITAFIVSVLWSFYWNNKFVFKKKEGQRTNILVSLAKTYVAYAFTGLFLSTFLSYIFIEKLSISKYVAPLLNLVISVPVNYIMNKFWAFKN